MTDGVSPRRTATRERLLDAASEVFARKGVVGASVEEICEAAGFSRGAFYSNFDTKEDLCLALLQREADDHLRATKDALATLPASALQDLSLDTIPLEDLIERAITMFLRSQRGDKVSVLVSSELRMHAAREEALRPGYQAFVERASSMFADILEETAAAIGMRFTLPPIQVTQVLHGLFEHTAIAALLSGEALDTQTRTKLLSGVLRSMLEPVPASDAAVRSA